MTFFAPRLKRLRDNLVAAAVALGLLLAAVSCGGAEPTATPTPEPTPTATAAPAPAAPSAQDLLASMADAMDAIQSGRVIIDVATDVALPAGSGEGNPGATILLDGEFQRPDRSRFDVSLKSAAMTADYEVVLIGGRSFVKFAPAPSWEAGAGGLLPFSDLFAIGPFNTATLRTMAADFLAFEVASLEGLDVHGLEAPVSGANLAALVGNPGVLNADGLLQMWVGREDNLPRNYNLEVRMPDPSGGEGGRMTMSMLLSGYGAPVDIQEPQVLEGGLQPGSPRDGPPAAIALDVGAPPHQAGVGDPYEYAFFTFSAEQGQDYVIDVTLGTLTDSVLVLYDTDGLTELDWNDDYGESLASRLYWTAPAAGEYYLAVQSVEGDAGDFAISVSVGS